jgi:hypothetical protein
MTLGLVREATRRADLEAGPSSAGTLPEHVLRRAYALTPRPDRTEPCACGGWIDALFRPIPDAIADHNGTLEHRAWRAVREAG